MIQQNVSTLILQHSLFSVLRSFFYCWMFLKKTLFVETET
mgnify:CR=1 FL=1